MTAFTNINKAGWHMGTTTVIEGSPISTWMSLPTSLHWLKNAQNYHYLAKVHNLSLSLSTFTHTHTAQSIRVLHCQASMPDRRQLEPRSGRNLSADKEWLLSPP